MDKLAQRRSKAQKFLENWSPGGIGGRLVENFSPEFSELMDNLRQVDDAVREIAAGDEGETLKDLLKVAQTNFNRREYMTAISFLGQFHERMEAIDTELKRLEKSVDMKHYEFLLRDVEPEHLEYITKKLGPKFEQLKAQKPASSIAAKASVNKEAGLTDWWHNLTSDRGKTLSAWEKRFPKYIKELKNQTNLMLTRSESLLSLLLNSLKAMSSLRNARKLEEYIKVSKRFQEKFKAYNLSFLQFYNNQVKRFLEYQQAMENGGGNLVPDAASPDVKAMPEKVTDPNAPDLRFNADNKEPPPGATYEEYQAELRKRLMALISASKGKQPPYAKVQEIIKSMGPEPKRVPKPKFDGVTFKPRTQPPPLPQVPPPPAVNSLPLVPEPLNHAIRSSEVFNPVESSELIGEEPEDTFPPTLPSFGIEKESPTLLGEEAPETDKDKETIRGLGSSQHQIFLESLGRMQGASPVVLAQAIINYATSIETTDFIASQKLLAIAKQIVHG